MLGNLLAARFGAAQVRRYVAQRREAGVTDATINRELAIVRRDFKLGVQEDPPLVLRSPAIPKLEENNVRQGFPAPEQYEKLPEQLRAILKTRSCALFACAVPGTPWLGRRGRLSVCHLLYSPRFRRSQPRRKKYPGLTRLNLRHLTRSHDLKTSLSHRIGFDVRRKRS